VKEGEREEDIISSDSQSKVEQETSSSPPLQPKLPSHYLQFKGNCCNCEDGKIFYQSQELDKTMLNFKQFVGIVRSTQLLKKKEKL